MKTIDCALAQDLMPVYTEGMLSPESREALEEHLAGCEACRRTADEMCHPLLEPQFQEEARLLRRLRRRLPDAMAELTPRQRQMVDMQFQEELTVTEIARRLGVNKSTVSRCLRRARQRLYSRLRFTL